MVPLQVWEQGEYLDVVGAMLGHTCKSCWGLKLSLDTAGDLMEQRDRKKKKTTTTTTTTVYWFVLLYFVLSETLDVLYGTLTQLRVNSFFEYIFFLPIFVESFIKKIHKTNDEKYNIGFLFHSINDVAHYARFRRGAYHEQRNFRSKRKFSTFTKKLRTLGDAESRNILATKTAFSLSLDQSQRAYLLRDIIKLFKDECVPIGT